MRKETRHSRDRATRRARLLKAAIAAAVALAVAAAAPGCGGGEDAGLRRAEAADRTLLGLHVFETPEKVDLSYRERFRNIKLELPWVYVQPSPGAFDWSVADKAVNSVLADGCESILLLLGGPIPAWARDPGYEPYSDRGLPLDLGDWYAYCAAVAERYGEVVDYYEIWNEPGWDRDSEVVKYGVYHFGGQVETEYLPLLQLGHAAVKEKDPSAAVICGALMYTLKDDPEVGAENYAMLFDDLNRPGQEVAIEVRAGQPIVAERLSGSDGGEGDHGGSTTVEAAAREEWSFPQGRIGSSVQEHLRLSNPGAAETEVTITFTMARGEAFSRKLTLAAGAAERLDLNRFIGFHGCCDMVSVHPYKSPRFWGPFYTEVVEALRSRGAEQEVVTSEAGWPHYSDKDPAAFSEQYQADAIGELGVGGLFEAGCRKIWVFRDVDEYPGTSWDGNYYGLFDHQGQPHPAWFSYLGWQEELPAYPELPRSLP